ncbi:putative protein OS=Streptomyces aurantiogriseus OX=66870 GN=GCM10010251_55690 PE=4 SV=1 [Streptomyces aurantiogriseus]|uniref:Uncharacterized protein n=1 Tax=Streptomyces aurantiogriseus TaxID=66870 RepID=A0A918CMA0_9ACTN|nr:hypothetical protein GCM10010251_55690 [Streptomyces aurantiogriseus]
MPAGPVSAGTDGQPVTFRAPPSREGGGGARTRHPGKSTQLRQTVEDFASFVTPLTVNRTVPP